VKIVLAALTGLGNFVFRKMHENGFCPTAVITRKELGRYPYFPIEHLDSEVEAVKGVRCFYSFDSLMYEKFDLLIVATYHQKISATARSKFGRCVNVHPSLLPSYKGPNPFFWTIKNGEEFSGVTIHELESEFDSGDIWSQQTVPLDFDETQGSLRLKLSEAAGELVVETLLTIGSLKSISLKPQSRNHGRESYFVRPNKQDFEVDFNRSAADTIRSIRSLIPYPGFLFCSEKIVNAYIEDEISTSVSIGSVVERSSQCIIVAARDANIRLVIEKD